MSRVNSAIVSGVTFCFNVAATVDSVREAMGRRENYETILINDASTDHTLERMQALAATDPHIRVPTIQSISASAALASGAPRRQPQPLS
jgi:glycosyltransferase involved in cell wall biosynthesis